MLGRERDRNAVAVANGTNIRGLVRVAELRS